MFRFKSGVKVDYNRQGYIYFTSRLYKDLPEEDQRVILNLCLEHGGESYDVAVGARGQMSKQQWSDVAKRIYEVSGIKIDDSVKYK